MAFFVNPKTQLSKNVYDTSVFAIELLLMLKSFSLGLSIDCGYAIGYGTMQLDGSNITQLVM